METERAYSNVSPHLLTKVTVAQAVDKPKNEFI
ncbi:Putative protein [Zobellia galactanivorans]|uniref:Uncharacterized protein n=1 Tax=Zobellia galactanivorans (strain DSM 12802 / CCUG 47099 / CIP 106680 / NCIMB 13871 / Dsij) TaxID=63186 RepID=G0L6A1_ZOBGA|nr:Putative protein [Zobellia galactanivorans]